MVIITWIYVQQICAVTTGVRHSVMLVEAIFSLIPAEVNRKY